MNTKRTYTIAMAKTSFYYTDYKYMTYKSLINFRKAIKRLKFTYSYLDLTDIRYYRYTNGTDEYTIYLG